MGIVRIHVDTPLTPGTEAVLPPAASHHVAVVLRMRAGAMLELFDGTGGCHRGIVVTAGKRLVTVQLQEFDARERESALDVTLVQGISRGQHMDYTLQKAVELGVTRIAPVLTEHGNVRLDETRTSRRGEHWRRLVIAACEQCGRNRVPGVDRPVPLGQWLLNDRNPCRLVFDPDAAAGLGALPMPEGRLSLLCGPEGGLSAQEIRGALAQGWRAIRLGPRILRTETAAVAVLAACQAMWGDMR